MAGEDKVSLSTPRQSSGDAYTTSTVKPAGGGTDELKTFDQDKSIEDAMTAVASAAGGEKGFNVDLKKRIEGARTPAQKARLEGKLERKEMRQGERAENVQGRKDKREAALAGRQEKRGYVHPEEAQGETTGVGDTKSTKNVLQEAPEGSADPGLKSAAESDWMKSMSAIAKNMPAAGGSGSFLPK